MGMGRTEGGVRWDEWSMHAERREHRAMEEEDDEEGTPWPGFVSCLWSYQIGGAACPRTDVTGVLGYPG